MKTSKDLIYQMLQTAADRGDLQLYVDEYSAEDAVFYMRRGLQTVLDGAVRFHLGAREVSVTIVDKTVNASLGDAEELGEIVKVLRAYTHF